MPEKPWIGEWPSVLWSDRREGAANDEEFEAWGKRAVAAKVSGRLIRAEPDRAGIPPANRPCDASSIN
jgi:hypothetical protein